MKRSSARFAFGLLATFATVLLIAQNVFFALEGPRRLLEKLPVKAFEYVNLASETAIWGLFAVAFFILTNDRRNVRPALIGGISCAISVVATVVCVQAGFSHWSVSALCFFLFVGYSLAVVSLKTSVPFGIRVMTIVAIGFNVLFNVGWQGARIYSQVTTCENMSSFYSAYGKIAIWPGILCWVVQAVHYVFQAIASGNGEDADNVLPARDAFCATCGARIHFAVNQNQVVCGNCGVPSFRGAAEFN